MWRLLIGVLVFWGSLGGSVEAFTGSLAVHVHQRSFKDERLGSMNGFKKLKPEFEVLMGFHEFYPRIEPIFAVSYTKSNATACAVEDDGFTCLPADQQTGNQDQFRAKMAKFGLGGQWKAWEPEFFALIPRVSAQLAYRHVWLEKATASSSGVNKINGGDFGVDLGGGFVWSFMYDQKRKAEMSSEWGLKDFGLSVQARYILAGLMKNGLGGISGTGGWSFGAGLLLDW
jgi:hypothetical protein